MEQPDFMRGAYTPDIGLIEAEIRRKRLTNLVCASIMAALTVGMAVAKAFVAPHLSYLDVFIPALAGGSIFVITALMEERIAPWIAAMIRSMVAMLTVIALFAALIPAALIYGLLMMIKPLRKLAQPFSSKFGKWLSFEERKARDNYKPA